MSDEKGLLDRIGSAVGAAKDKVQEMGIRALFTPVAGVSLTSLPRWRGGGAATQRIIRAFNPSGCMLS